jgi:hypothetical protein
MTFRFSNVRRFCNPAERFVRFVTIAFGCVTILPPVASAQILETETARPLRRGQVEVGAGYELQHSREGDEVAIPLAFEFGLTNRIGLLVEPVPYTAIRPEVGDSATGPGDLEITASFLLRNESGKWPALALGLEEKIPTAKNTLIGTGKADHTAYLIGSKRLGRFDVHGNAGYTMVGSPKGQSLSNRVSGALATEFSLAKSTSLYGEVLASTSAGGGEGDGTVAGAASAPEVSGDEFQMTLGIAHSVGRRARYSLGVTRDNARAIQIRPGITLLFR